ncbi:MAG: DNA-3-methyladenine glycosylase family protein [Solirubrobacterales bacterium]
MKPPWPFRLPRRGGGDGVMRSRGGVVTRLLHIDECPIVVNVWQRREGTVRFRAAGEAGEETLELAISRMRFALSVDENLRPFYDEFRSDPVLGPAIRRHPHLRPRRRPWPWEALAAAITAQLIESGRALQIQRRMVRRWGRERSAGGGDRLPLRDTPPVDAIAGLAPAELAACDLAPKRAIALIRCAREVASGRIDLANPADDHRLLAITDIGPWTVQCLGLDGRGEDDSLPAGDLAYVKLVGRLAGLGRRAEIEEIDDYFARYEPYRGLAGYFLNVHYHHAVQTGPPLRLAA